MSMKFRKTLTGYTHMALAAGLLLPQFAAAANLSEIYEMAASRDSVIQASRAQYQAAVEALPLARSTLLPQVALTGDIAKNEVNDDQDGSFDSNSLGASITQFVYNAPASRSVKRAKATVAQAEASLKEAEQNLMFRIPGLLQHLNGERNFQCSSLFPRGHSQPNRSGRTPI